MEKNKSTNPLFRIRGVEKSFGEQKILSKIDIDIYSGDRIGLVGYNGTGKTTLANLIFGMEEPDEGTIERVANCKIGFLQQSTDFKINNTDVHDTDGPVSLYKHTSLLGLEKVQIWNTERFNHLSCGEKLKLALAEIWSFKPDALILDEPTNHLDLKGVEWLISELKSFSGPILLISHDRHFLDLAAHKIVEIDGGTLSSYEGNYTYYKKEKQLLYESQLHQYSVQQRKKKEIEDQIDQLKRWSISAHTQSTKKGTSSERRQIGFKEYHRMKAKKMDNQVKSKMKRLNQELEKNKIIKPIEDPTVSFELRADGKRGKRIIDANRITKLFDDRILFKDCDFYIKHRDRIGLLGENGCGKTTLIRALLNIEPLSMGNLWVSDSLKIGYLSQDVEGLPLDKTVIEALGISSENEIYKARTMLANMGLKENTIKKKVEQLSMGERTRVKLVELLMKDYDTLILDEPTNHLDLPSREQFEKALTEFTGALIIVSHDHFFMNKICEKLLVFENKKIKRVEMGLLEFRNKSTEMKKVDSLSHTEELMLLENRMASILGEISLLDHGSEQYIELDSEYLKLFAKKQQLM